MLRRRLAVLVTTAMLLAMTLTSGVALAEPGKGQGVGGGVGGGDPAHIDNGNHLGTAKGEGPNNNPHNDGDTTAPETTVDSLDTSNVATDGSVVAHFSSNEPGSTFECKLVPMNELGEEINLAPFEPCTSPNTYNDLGWFSYRFYVRATDAAGNVDDTPATQVFDAKVDTVSPDAAIIDGPADGATVNANDVAFEWEASDNRLLQTVAMFLQQPGSSAILGDHGTEWVYGVGPEVNPVTFSDLADGTYTAVLVAEDKAGNRTFVERTFTVDTTVP